MHEGIGIHIGLGFFSYLRVVLIIFIQDYKRICFIIENVSIDFWHFVSGGFRRTMVRLLFVIMMFCSFRFSPYYRLLQE